MIAALALPIELETRTMPLTVRRATADDLEAILRLIYDDPVSAARDDGHDAVGHAQYLRVLAEILDDPRNDVIVGSDAAGRVIATLQLTTIPGLSRGGGLRVQVEAVRVAPGLRSSGVGSALMRWVLDVAAPALGASLVQLTSDAARSEAQRFYLRLGFAGSHLGYKYYLR